MLIIAHYHRLLLLILQLTVKLVVGLLTGYVRQLAARSTFNHSIVNHSTVSHSTFGHAILCHSILCHSILGHRSTFDLFGRLTMMIEVRLQRYAVLL